MSNTPGKKTVKITGKKTVKELSSKAAGPITPAAGDDKIASKSDLMIDAHLAARQAAEYLKSLNPAVSSITVEEIEVERADGQTCWVITLSYRETVPLKPIPTVFEVESVKGYKIFRVHASTGEVLSMKIRNV